MSTRTHPFTQRRALPAILAFLLAASPLGATGRNLAPRARATAVGSLDEAHGPERAIDGVVLRENQGEWACSGYVTSWGEIFMPWIRLDWDEPVTIDRVVLYDRAAATEHLAGGTLSFSDGSKISVTGIPNHGGPREIRFPAKTVEWLHFEATDGNGKNLGLSEIEVFQAPGPDTPYTEWVDPYIETTRGRWFFCTPGARPMGMVAAHAFTRNKNQGGGGYNYNFTDILGFTQINDWMIAGPNLMPVEGTVNPLLGMEGWKSPFVHESEVIRPGYHKLYLDRYRTWVEYTATDRVALYRLSYAAGSRPGVLVDCGSILGNCSQKEAFLYRLDAYHVAGLFMTTDRFWGGPDKIGLYFVLESDVPITQVDGWTEKGLVPGADGAAGNQAGLFLHFDAETVCLKMALSYTDIANAQANLEAEAAGRDFDAVAEETEAIWNEALGRIQVEGGTTQQTVKFYTDLWHVLLGRHKINDVTGTYPDYAYGTYEEHRTDAPMRLRQLPMAGENQPAFNMYGFDALWLTQWNLNILWGLAWPEILDDFSACLVQYAENGGLLPRGACAGGYSFIMTGCPASNLLTSTYLKGLMTKVDPERAYTAIRRNHLPGGMMSFENADDLNFYIRNGWCPDNAGKTLEWAFQDWGLSRMAARLGHTADAAEFERRSHGWTALFNSEQGLIFPKDSTGAWVHTDPLSGKGWVEANAWQATWSVSHDLDALIARMGGRDRFCQQLNHAFEEACSSDFVHAYSGGYVSYANQPGCSNAHLFSYAGKPWLTQYWVRRVNEQAYGGTAPDLGYGGHDEDQGQMGAVSALMSMGLFSATGTQTDLPCYDITAPVFRRISIALNPAYYPGRTFEIQVHGDPTTGDYIQKARLNGRNWPWFQFTHETFREGGTLDLWLGPNPARNWGKRKY